MWWKRDNNKPDKDSKSSDGNNANGSSSNSSGNKSNHSPSSLSATGQGGGSGSSSPPPCIFPCVADNNPGIHYSTSWTLNPHPFFQTSHETDVVGSSLSFPFTGSFSNYLPVFWTLTLLRRRRHWNYCLRNHSTQQCNSYAPNCGISRRQQRSCSNNPVTRNRQRPQPATFRKV